MINTRSWLVVAGFGAMALVAGCSSSGGSGSGSAAGGMTVALRNVSGDEVLVNASGHTLYTSEQEQSGKIVCATSDCEAIWTPLTIAKGQQPTGPSGVAGKLGTIKRPDGSIQVTYRGGPLYTFTFDHSAGEVSGDGKKDSFNGTNFVWHAATANGAAVAPSVSSSGSGGYGY